SRQKSPRLDQMLDDGPECNGVKTPRSEIKIQERLADGFDSAPFGVIEGGAGDVHSCDGVIFREKPFQLKQKRAGRAADTQHGARPAVSAKKPQFPLESHGSV